MTRWTIFLTLTAFLLLGQQSSGQTFDSTKYMVAIKSADICFALKDYVNAKTFYVDACKIKPGDNYATGKLATCDSLLKEQAMQKMIDAQYKDAISKADSSFSKNRFIDAEMYYRQASSYKPTEQYPKDKIAFCKLQLSILAQTVDINYQDAISIADKSFSAKNFEMAKKYYYHALTLKSGDKYATEQIKQCDKLLSEQKK